LTFSNLVKKKTERVNRKIAIFDRMVKGKVKQKPFISIHLQKIIYNSVFCINILLNKINGKLFNVLDVNSLIRIKKDANHDRRK
jgi:hypothetical protein